MSGKLRQSGRTTRLIADAVKHAEQRRAVYVVCNDLNHAALVSSLIPDGLGIKVETPATLGSSWDWERLRVTGAHSNCVFLVDHWVIESRFAMLLEMLHRYDPPTRPTP